MADAMYKVVVLMHVGEAAVKKVWRFDGAKINQYSRAQVEEELILLFPDTSRKGFKFSLCYKDDMAGEVFSMY